MALTPVPSINLESLPSEAISLIETLAGRAQEADRLEQENRLLREMIRIMRLEKYGPKSEKLSDEQLGTAGIGTRSACAGSRERSRGVPRAKES